MKWFKHDSDASIDAKLQELLLDYGASGYGLYWYCVELIAQGVDKTHFTFELEHDARIIAKNLNLTVAETTDMMKKMVSLNLFSLSKNNRLACYALANRLDSSMTSNKDFREMITNYKQSHDSVMIKSEKVMQDKIRREEIRKEDKTIVDFSKHKNINQSAANEWFEHKKYKSKAPITKILNFLNQYSHKQQQQIVDTSIMNGWKGLFEPKGNSTQNKSLHQRNTEAVEQYFRDGNTDAIEVEVE